MNLMKHRMIANAASASMVVSLMTGCMHTSTRSRDVAAASGASAAQSAPGWRPLFDGKTLSGWRGYRQTTAPAGWRVVDGVITKQGSVEDLVTRDQFGDFELAFEWKLDAGGNSGLFYRATEEYDHIYWSAPEYQLLDDARHPDGRSRLTAAGAAYGLYPAPAGVVKPANEWNASLILVRGAHVEHWMNGQKLLEYDLWSPEWEAKVKASKFGAWPNYGRAHRGYVGIQGDHDGALSVRNIRIRELQ
ncbi:MAG TPA: DUF1080 domain-containing protein [Candidatus Elarobacter sp.]|nr:DUF1080 domain-containing protein [Candidatus Elarobacter sp.]